MKMFVRHDAEGRSVSITIALPRDRYNAELQQRLLELVQARFGGESVDQYLSLGETELAARIHFTVHVTGPPPDVSLTELEHEVIALTRTWDDRLARAAGGHLRRGARRPAGRDVPRAVPRLLQELDRHLDGAGRRRAVRAPRRRRAVPRRAAERARRPAGPDPRRHLQDRRQGAAVRGAADPREPRPAGRRGGADAPQRRRRRDLPAQLRRARTRTAGCSTWPTAASAWPTASPPSGTARPSPTRSTGWSSPPGLTWHQVAVLRAYRKYRQRVGAQLPIEYQNATFARHPDVSALLVRYFEVRFDPTRPIVAGEEDALRQEIIAALDAITSLDDDRILRNHLGTVDATVRTNAFLNRPHLSFKFASAAVPLMPKPYPLYEIFVYSPAMEGIHLRGGRVARGGIRWSDRPEDYRTEILGLMKAQMVKNAVIVPVGSKGGFVLKHPPADRQALRDEVVRQYTTLMSGMLDITDNLVDGTGRAPRRRAHPGRRGPVPGGRGRQGHGDAVRHRERHLGVVRLLARRRVRVGRLRRLRPQEARHHGAGRVGVGQAPLPRARPRTSRTEPFTVVGVGDMSGDVFGNGMLLSDQIRLVGAFDHRHLFLDPDPDPAVGFAERERLYDLPGSSWDDYDRSKISAGGGVFPLDAKSVPLGPELRRRARPRRLGHGAAAGRAEDGDPARAGRPVLERRHRHVREGLRRVARRGRRPHQRRHPRRRRATCASASSARAATSASRSAAASSTRRHGGRINTDAVDNSAGVDCSDHEVNLKILLGIPEAAGDLTRKQRDELLRRGRGRRLPARALRQLPAGADPLAGGGRLAGPHRGLRRPHAPARGRRRCWSGRSSSCRRPRRWPSATGRAVRWSARSCACCSPTPSAA